MNELPQFVIETDYAGSEYDLKKDVGLWLEGATPFIWVLINVKWEKLADGKIAGHMIVTRFNTSMQVTGRERVEVFLTPASGHQTIDITRAELTGLEVFDGGRSPDDRFQLNVNHLRQFASEAMTSMGLTPA